MSKCSNVFIKNVMISGIGEKNLAIENGKIVRIGELDGFEAPLVIDAKGLYAVPGLIDIHTHGGNGIDIVHCSDSEFDELTMFYASCGVTSFLPTVGTSEDILMENAVAKIARVAKTGVKGAKPIGIHLEGPCLSKEYCGAQPTEYFKEPDAGDFDRLYEMSSGLLKLITIAPELKGSLEFIKHISSKGVVASIGHTGATFDTCLKAVESGAKSVTHTLNGMRAFHQHEPSVLGAAVLSDLYCEMICDGRHLHPKTVEFLIRAKGVDRLILVTDSLMAAGLSDGVYDGFIKIIVKYGDAKLESGSRAGSTLKANEAVRNVRNFAGIGMDSALPMMTWNPACLIGVESYKGKLCENYDADIVLIDEEMNVKLTMVEGKVVYDVRGNSQSGVV